MTAVPRRPDLNLALLALIEDIARRMPEFSHIRADRLLGVAGEARRASRGAVKPLTFSKERLLHPSGKRKPEVRLDGKRMLYCITLRPLFFRDSTPAMRIATVLHELFHISPRFDGSLAEERRHEVLGRRFAPLLEPLVRRYLSACPGELQAPFSVDGDVTVLHWLERPPALLKASRGPSRQVYTEEQLYSGRVRMVTPPA